MKKFLIIAAVVIIPVGLGLFAVSTANAQEGDLNVFQRVAQILGVEENDLTDAFKQAQKEEIDQKVAEGKLDAEKAEEMKSKIDESERPFLGPKGERRHMKGEGGEAMSEFLGISVDELREVKESGKTMDELLEEYGKTQEELQEFMQEKKGDRPCMHGSEE